MTGVATASSGPDQTRARTRAREAAELVVRGVKTPSLALRTPRVLVALAIGPVTVNLLVQRRRGGRWEVRWPVVDGAEGVALRPKLREAAEAAAVAAVKADPEAAHYLQEGWRSAWGG